MSAITTGVVVVHWRGMADLLECLTSLAPVAAMGMPVVLAVNGGGDFDDGAARAACPGVEIIVSAENRGYAAGCNLGARAMGDRVDAVLFLNNDVVVPAGLIDALAAVFEERAEVGVAGTPVVYHDEPSRVWALGGRLNRTLGYSRHVGFDGLSPNTGGGGDVDYVNGSAIAVRRTVLDRLGGWDESYFHFWDEVDLCERARSLGYTAHVATGPAVPHKVSASTGNRGSARFNRAQAYYFSRNRVRFFMRRSRGWRKMTALIAQPALVAYEAAKALGGGNRDEARGRIEGLVDGLLGRSGQRRGGW